jgi:NAD(P)-dependent dehydrogenase (short-subunit alcohol dehydrogenase family)
MREEEVYMSKLENKVVVVTGASQGTGVEIARLFAAEGWENYLQPANSDRVR